MSLKTSQHAKNIGARFRSARSLVPNLNRKSFCERHEINRYTMQSWENGLHVSKGKNVEKFIEALAKEGIFCTSEWLIDGVGEPAQPFFEAQSSAPLSPPSSEEQEDEANNKFQYLMDTLIDAHELMGEAIIKVRLNDESMAPKFRAGDWLLGLDISDYPKKAHEKYCLIELSEDRFIVRKVYYAKEQLLLTALDDRVKSFHVAAGLKIYEVIWHLLEQ